MEHSPAPITILFNPYSIIKEENSKETQKMKIKLNKTRSYNNFTLGMIRSWKRKKGDGNNLRKRVQLGFT